MTLTETFELLAGRYAVRASEVPAVLEFETETGWSIAASLSVHRPVAIMRLVGGSYRWGSGEGTVLLVEAQPWDNGGLLESASG